MPKPSKMSSKTSVETKTGFLSDLMFALQGKCPVCRQGKLYSAFLKITPECETCHAPLGDHDIGDGAAVLMIFVLGFSIIPLAWCFDLWLAPPIWVHALFVLLMSGGMVFVLLPWVKSYIMLLEYKHRTQDEWSQATKEKTGQETDKSS